MDSDASYITNFFLQKHICLNEEWLEAAISMLQQQYQISSQDHLAAAVFEQWIFSDISQSTHPLFQLPDQNAKKIDGVFIFQVTSVHDIGSSIYSQYRDATHKADNFDFFDVIPKEEQSTEMQFKEKTNRMLLFELSDGHNTLKAIEYRTIPKISSSIMPGAKILLHGSIQKRKDILWLTASNCQLLGGDLDTLCQLNQKEAFLGRKLKIEKYKNETVAQISQSNTSSSSTFSAAVQEISVVEDIENISPTTAARSNVPRKPKIVPEVITLSPCKPVATVQPIVQRNRQSGDGNSSIRGLTLNIPDAPEPFISANHDPEQEPLASKSRQSASNRGATFRFPDSPNASQTETDISTSASEQIQPSATAVQRPRNRQSALNKGPSFRFPASPESSQTEENISITSSNSSTPAQPVRNTVPKPRNRQSASSRGPSFRFPESPDRDTSNNTSSTISEPLQSTSNTVQRPRNRTSKSSNRGPSFRFPASPEPEQEETTSSSILSNAVEQNISTQPRPNHPIRPPPVAITTPPKSQIKLEEVVPETPEDSQPIIPPTVSQTNQQAARAVFHFPNNVGSLLDEKPTVENVNSSEDVRPPPRAVQKRSVKIEMPDDDDDDIIILETSPLLLPPGSPKREIKLEENEVVPGTPEDDQPIIPSTVPRKSQTTAENAARKLVLDYSSSSVHTPIDKKMSQVEITENIPPPSPSRFSKSIQKRPLKIEIHDIDDDDDAESNPQPSRSSTSFTFESPEAKKSRIINDPSPSQSSLVTKYKELKLSKIAQALNSMKFSVGSKKMKITAYMVDIVKPLNIDDDGEWTMKIQLKDETCENLDCFLSNQLLCKLIGMTSDEAKMLKKSNNFDKRREGTERLKNLNAQLERLDLIYEIEFYAANRATPRIIEMETYTDALI